MTPPIAGYAVNENTVVQFETAIGTQPGARGWIRDAAAPALDGAAVLLELARGTSADKVEIKFGLKVTGEASWIVAQQEATPAPTNVA